MQLIWKALVSERQQLVFSHLTKKTFQKDSVLHLNPQVPWR